MYKHGAIAQPSDECVLIYRMQLIINGKHSGVSFLHPSHLKLKDHKDYVIHFPTFKFEWMNNAIIRPML